MDITVDYAETIEETFVLRGATFESGDVLLFVVRHTGDVLLWKTLTPAWSEIVGAYVAVLSISHAESEASLPVGQHQYGLTLYRDATITNGIPTSGTIVDTLINSQPFLVNQSEAREAGLV